jgi:hypothetical protein
MGESLNKIMNELIILLRPSPYMLINPFLDACCFMFIINILAILLICVQKKLFPFRAFDFSCFRD